MRERVAGRGERTGTSATTGFVLDALEQTIHARRSGPEDAIIYHSDWGVQYLAMNYTQRMAFPIRSRKRRRLRGLRRGLDYKSA